MNKMIIICTTTIAASLGTSCLSSEAKAQAEAWELETPEAQTIAAPTPSSVEDGRVTFEPGELPWADPEHRVVFHSRAESDANKGDRTIPVVYPGEGFLGDRVDEDALYHRLDLARWSFHFGRGKPVSPSADPKSKPDTLPDYRGVYLPGDLDTNATPTLHLFEASEKPNENAVYVQDGLIFDWRVGRDFNIHVPQNHPGYEWLKCQKLLKNYEAVNASGDFCGEPTDVETNYRVVIWYGDNPATDADPKVYTFNVYTEQITRDVPSHWTRAMRLKHEELLFQISRHKLRDPESDYKPVGPRLYD